MAASNLNLGKASGGVLNIQPADGTTNTSLVLPAINGTVVAADSNGNVGIGGTASSFGGYTSVTLDNATNGGIYNIKVNGTETARLQAYSGIFNIAAKGATTNLTFETNDAERMRVDANGNVGIGAVSNNSRVYIEQLNASNNALTVFHNSNLQTQKIVSISNGLNGGTEVLKVDGSGNLLLTSSTGGLGYGTGAGGTVTQLTSKSTAVTLNKPTGYITMNNAALAAGATASFTVFNSLAGIGSVVLSGIQGTDNYSVETRSNFNNGFTVYVTNKTAGSLADHVQIQFILLKGATA